MNKAATLTVFLLNSIISFSSLAGGFDSLTRPSRPFPKTGDEVFNTQPVLFTENNGQLTYPDGQPAADILFTARQGSTSVYVGSGSLHYQFRGRSARGSAATHRYSLHLANANPEPNIRKELPSAYHERYISSDANSQVVAKSYRMIVMEEVYPGIDWVLYSDGQNEEKQGFKYDFILKPGADPSQIQLKITNASETYIDEKGALSMETKLGTVKESPPLSYSGQRTIPTRFRVLEENLYGFELGAYDKSKELVIDPDVEWITYHTGVGLEGDISDAPAGCTVDPAGNVYLFGSTQSATGIAQDGYQDEINGEVSAFVVKFSSAGQRLWGTYFGGSFAEFGHACTTDQAGNIYFTGKTHSNDLPTTAGAHQSTLSDHGSLSPMEAFDVFLGKMSGSGELLWSTYFGGDHEDYVHGCTTDSNGNIYIAGETKSINLPTDGSSYQQEYSGNSDRFQYDAFLAKFSTTGEFQWTTYYGGAFVFEYGRACATDAFGNVYLAGNTSGGVPATPEVFQTVYGGGGSDAFLAKFNANGGRIWSTFLGGSAADRANACTVDAEGNIYIAGSTSSVDFPVLLPFQDTFGGGGFAGDAFLAKFDNTGSLRWSTYYGGEDYDEANTCTLDVEGNVYLAGRTNSVGGIAYNGFKDEKGDFFKGFVAKFNPGGSRIWGSYFGGNAAEMIKSAATDQNNNLFIIGSTLSSDLATPDSFKPDNTYATEAYFIGKIFDDTRLSAPVVYVDKSATGDNDGTSWANAYTSLQDALGQVCGAGNTISEQTQIWVASETYYPDEGAGLTQGDRNLSFELCDKTAVYGGFAGNEAHLSERDISANPVILSGDLDHNEEQDDFNSFGVVEIKANTLAAIIDGFTITMGNANNVSCTNQSKSCNGGGLYSGIGSSPRVQNIRFINNYTSGEGGGLFSYQSGKLLKVSNSVFQQNIAGSGGGGLQLYQSKGTIINSLFANNSVEAGTGGGIKGAGVGYLKIDNTTIAGNSANTSFTDNGTRGGGIALNDDNLILSNSIVWGNSSGINISAPTSISYSLVQGRDGTTGTGNVDGSTDPEFVNVAGFNYRLSVGSPVVNAGNPNTDAALFQVNRDDVPGDLEGNERFYGPRIDMGAYELIHESALPVTLVGFSGELRENTAVLTWQTTSERNTSHFEVQRSSDAENWETIGKVHAKGESTGLRTYHFTDFSVQSSQSLRYYRLKILDFDKSFSNSSIVSLRSDQIHGSFLATLYPNPAKERVWLKSIDWSNVRSVRLYNQTGQEASFTVDKQGQSLLIGHLPVGLYLLRLENKNSPSQTYRLMVGR